MSCRASGAYPGQSECERMRRSRQVIAVMVVTTALCADSFAASAPSLRPLAGEANRSSPLGVGELAGGIVGRLSQSFRRVAPSAAPMQSRRQELAAQAAPAPRADRAADLPHPTL